ncbi:aminotransferase class I/II-fold pyridoxal phosphate-dependent enzyme [Galbibacter mesophilus]|uniref:aminotransferase class I/II-fold pyridoxal phosphate-dependent enzyme n=1 Tax=Galbibacter mesophilus TaxID=379069 RepID=UPI00191F5F43|nr:pyridoxal phosphate-dependent aminotransferase family protein [Galbibacter mesophilus]MCM5662702.1 pyridoxal phosphate-dependent aminotransferase family protein [Galbibacter mesophilus]
MNALPKRLAQKLAKRNEEDALRKLPAPHNLVDFSSNDYLGFAASEILFSETANILKDHNIQTNGATGSRLITGNYHLYEEVENTIARFHNSEAALIYNSGYDANLGFFSTVPQRGDVILFDELSHASIRDGISLCPAKAFKFRHNDISDLKSKLARHASQIENTEYVIYVVTEAVFSMDGDSPDLKTMVNICKEFNAHIIVDEAHAVGVFGASGEGLTQALKLEHQVFARIVTFGKALGCHGAAVLGSTQLKNYLVNFSRSFIYTTALPPHSLAAILNVYQQLNGASKSAVFQKNVEKLKANIAHFKKLLKDKFTPETTLLGYIESESAIQCIIVRGNKEVKKMAGKLQDSGFNVKPILSPTVPKNEERLRFCIHSFNTFEEIAEVANLLSPSENV